MASGQFEAVLIAGPTASGKSALALRLASAFGGTVINADSMQVYRDLRIITNRPTPEEEAAAPHRLFGTVDGAENFSAGRYVAALRTALAGADAAGTLPILVGGTGLYFRAATEGLSAIPPVPDEVRARVRAEAEGHTSPELHATLSGQDPDTAARLKPGDRQRVLRALEVFAASGQPLSAFRAPPAPGPLASCRRLEIFILPERSELRARIDRRFEAMMAEGAAEEVAALAQRRLDPALPVMRAHGVPGLLARLRGEITLAEAVKRGQADTRAYAKRQVTWFRHQMPGFAAVAPEAAYNVAARALEAGLNATGRKAPEPGSVG